MSNNVRLLSLAGSLRRNSWNNIAAEIAADAARAAGAEVTHIRLIDFDLPLFNEDEEKEKGLPAGVIALKELLQDKHGIIVASPEYNGSISGALKNAIDWISRPAPQLPPTASFRGKAGGLLSTSPGYFGGIQGLGHTHAILQRLGVHFVTQQLAIPNAGTAFSDDRTSFSDPKMQSTISTFAASVVSLAARLHSISTTPTT